MISKRFLIGVLFSITSALSSSQTNFKPGFIITDNSDTINGFINYRSNYKNSISCEFKTGGKSEVRTYYPGEIKGYKIENSKFYVSKEIPGKNEKQTVFLEYMLDGIVDLFFLKELNGSCYFIEKEGKLYQLSNDDREVIIDNVTYLKKNNQYISVLNMLFQESPQLINDIANTTFSYKALIAITKDYHNSICTDKKCIDYSKSTKVEMWIEPNAGLNISWMGFTTSQNYASNICLAGGINLRFIPYISQPLWNFQTGLSFCASEFTGVFSNTLNDYKAYPLNIHTEYITACIPLTLEYNFPERKIQPYLSLSYNNILLLNSKYEISIKTGNGIFPLASAFRKYQYGLSLAAGLKFHLNDSRYLFIKNEIVFRKSAVNFNEILDYTRVYSDMIRIGLGIKIK